MPAVWSKTTDEEMREKGKGQKVEKAGQQNRAFEQPLQKFSPVTSIYIFLAKNIRVNRIKLLIINCANIQQQI